MKGPVSENSWAVKVLIVEVKNFPKIGGKSFLELVTRKVYGLVGRCGRYGKILKFFYPVKIV